MQTENKLNPDLHFVKEKKSSYRNYSSLPKNRDSSINTGLPLTVYIPI